MDPLKTPTIHKYFDLLDRFVRIRLADPSHLPLEPGPELDGRGYRREVIRSCVEGFESCALDALERLAPGDPESAEDELYRLVVSVNPMLDIRTVGLQSAPEDVRAPLPETNPDRDEVANRRRRLRRRVRGLAERLGEHVIGQEHAIASVVSGARRAAAGLSEDTRPLASFLFLGRTGTGKTALAIALARELGELELVRLDCTEYAEGHEYSKLIGAPPGFVGHDHGGVLTEAVRNAPTAVVLFDEVEKAHPRMHNLMLQILDAGRLTDGHGQAVDFRQTIVVLTSNAGASAVARASQGLGFGHDPLSASAAEEITTQALDATFSPEFLGRIDDSVNFRDLSPADARVIAGRQLTDLAARVRRRGLRLRVTPAVARWVAKRGFSLRSGAREIARVLRREIEAPLADALLDGPRGGWIRLSIRGDRPRFDPE